MKALVVDDEPLARKELRRLLGAFPNVRVVGEAANVREAEAKVLEHSPDVVFLDIHMPGGTGLDLLERLEQAPLVVFTTAYDQHAVQAFEVNALDYLLKPVEAERLEVAITRVTRRLSEDSLSGGAPSEPTADAGSLSRLFVRDGARCWFVPLAEVRLLVSEGNFTELYWNDARPMLGRSLVQFEPRLDPRRFFRANRKAIVNLDFVEQVEVGLGGRIHLSLRGGPEVEVSRRQAKLFRSRTSA